MVRVLVLVDHFLPGHRAGGPVRSVAQLVEGHSGDDEIAIITRDCDVGSAERYEVATHTWVRALGANVHYANLRSRSGWRRAFRHVRQSKPDLVYLNSLWSPIFTLAPLIWMRGTRRRSVVLLAPRGSCGPEALAIKSRKKSVVSFLLRRWLRWSNLVWHSTSDAETADIATWMGALPPRIVTRSSPGPVPRDTYAAPPRGGRLRVVGVSRIVPIKDVDRFFRILGQVRVEVDATYYGPLEDRDYWAACQRLIDALPSNVRFTYGGEVSPEEVTGIFATADIFLFPTRGENFGHVIAEAMSVGCPVLTTPTTIWTPLIEGGSGCVFTTDAEAVEAIERVSVTLPDVQDQGRASVWQGYRAWFDSNFAAKSLFSEAIDLVPTVRRGG